mmetsp:Transcript_13771/g.27333  ORF Transcript_13771/g.27333 Transcript_13771/m.27333 type:complete len:905 (+) Transcript_13771:65-2779(+)
MFGTGAKKGVMLHLIARVTLVAHCMSAELTPSDHEPIPIVFARLPGTPFADRLSSLINAIGAHRYHQRHYSNPGMAALEKVRALASQALNTTSAEADKETTKIINQQLENLLNWRHPRMVASQSGYGDEGVESQGSETTGSTAPHLRIGQGSTIALGPFRSVVGGSHPLQEVRSVSRGAGLSFLVHQRNGGGTVIGADPQGPPKDWSASSTLPPHVPLGPKRPLAIAMVSDPVARCFDAVLDEWQQRLKSGVTASGGATGESQNHLHKEHKNGARSTNRFYNGAPFNTSEVLTQLLIARSQGGFAEISSYRGDGGGGIGGETVTEEDAVTWEVLQEVIGEVRMRHWRKQLDFDNGFEGLDGFDAYGGASPSSSLPSSSSFLARCRNEQWRLLRPRIPVKVSPPPLPPQPVTTTSTASTSMPEPRTATTTPPVKQRLQGLPTDAGEAWGLTPLLVLAQFDLVMVADKPHDLAAYVSETSALVPSHGTDLGEETDEHEKRGEKENDNESEDCEEVFSTPQMSQPYGMDPRGPYAALGTWAMDHGGWGIGSMSSNGGSGSGKTTAAGAAYGKVEMGLQRRIIAKMERRQHRRRWCENGVHFMQSLVVLQLSLGLSLGDLMPRPLPTDDAQFLAHQSSKEWGREVSAQAEAAANRMKLVALFDRPCAVKTSTEEPSPVPLSMAHGRGLIADVMAMNSLDLELHALAQHTNAMRARSFNRPLSLSHKYLASPGVGKQQQQYRPASDSELEAEAWKANQDLEALVLTSGNASFLPQKNTKGKGSKSSNAAQTGVSVATELPWNDAFIAVYGDVGTTRRSSRKQQQQQQQQQLGDVQSPFQETTEGAFFGVLAAVGALYGHGRKESQAGNIFQKSRREQDWRLVAPVFFSYTRAELAKAKAGKNGVSQNAG